MIRRCYPSQVRSRASERETRHGMRPGHPTDWPLFIGGPFCFYPRQARTNAFVARFGALADAVSAKLALPVRRWRDNLILHIQVEVSDEEWQRILEKEYAKATRRRRRLVQSNQ